MAVADRTKNAKRNIVFGLVNKFFSICIPFLTRTFLIKTIGSEYLGIDSLFVSILQILNLSELGFSSAVVYCMYKPMAENNQDMICALLNFIRKVYKYVGLFILAIGLCLIPFLGYFIKGAVPSDINLVFVYSVFLFNTVISYLLFGYKNSLLNASQRVDVISNCASVTKGLLAVGQGIALYLTYNYYYYLLLLPLTTITNNLLVYYYVKRLFPQYRCYGTVPREVIKGIKKNVMGLFATKFCGGLRNSVETLSISAFIGLTSTAIYSNYYTLISSVASICAIMVTSLVPSIGNSIVTETKEKNYQWMRSINLIYMWTSSCVAICLLSGIQLFMQLWLGDKMVFPQYIAFLFPVYFYVLRMGDIKAIYQEATGLWWQNRYRAIGEIVLNIVLNVWLIHVLGVPGVVIATVVSLLIVNFGFGSHIVFKYYFQNGKLKEFFLDHVCFLICTVFSGIVVYGISLELDNSIISCILKLLFSVCIPSFLLFLVFHKNPCFTESVVLVRRILKI